MQEIDILHDNGTYWVGRVRNAKRKRFDYAVYRVNGTHSVRCAIFAFEDETYALSRAKAECDRRAALVDA